MISVFIFLYKTPANKNPSSKSETTQNTNRLKWHNPTTMLKTFTMQNYLARTHTVISSHPNTCITLSDPRFVTLQHSKHSTDAEGETEVLVCLSVCLVGRKSMSHLTTPQIQSSLKIKSCQ